jgi:polyisoprenoid-binding protein YceI
MKNILLAAVLFITSSVMAQNTSWVIDNAHSNVQFSVTHLVISEVTGLFKKFEGNITSTGNDFTKGNINFTVDVNSISTDNEQRDNHLKSDDFFNAAKYPKITFKGTSFYKVSGNNYKLKGYFTMRDVTKPIVLDVVYKGTIKDPWGNERAGFKITGKVNRFDYGLKWNNLVETGGAVVGKEVTMTCNIELTKKK